MNESNKRPLKNRVKEENVIIGDANFKKFDVSMLEK